MTITAARNVRSRDRNGRFVRGYASPRPEAPILVIGEDRVQSYTLVREVMAPRRASEPPHPLDGWTECLAIVVVKLAFAVLAVAVALACFRLI